MNTHSVWRGHEACLRERTTLRGSMVAACPKCQARYRVDDAQMGAEGVRLRCTRCQAVFRVLPPQAAAATPVQAPAPPAAQVPLDRSRLVLIADSQAESAKQTAQALSQLGLQPVLVHDGVEAMMSVQRTMPRAVVLEVALPGMAGSQLCEIIKRNESLRGIPVILIGSAQDQQRAGGTYGGDDFVERGDLPNGLAPALRRLGLPLSGASSAAAPQGSGPMAPAVSQPAPAPVAPPAPAASDALTADRDKAQRLARIIVSDIILYNQEKFDAAVAAGNVAEAMDADLAEGRQLFRQRIKPEVRDETDYLVAELVRVAKLKGMQ